MSETKDTQEIQVPKTETEKTYEIPEVIPTNSFLFLKNIESHDDPSELDSEILHTELGYILSDREEEMVGSSPEEIAKVKAELVKELTKPRTFAELEKEVLSWPQASDETKKRFQTILDFYRKPPEKVLEVEKQTQEPQKTTKVIGAAELKEIGDLRFIEAPVEIKLSSGVKFSIPPYRIVLSQKLEELLVKTNALKKEDLQNEQKVTTELVKILQKMMQANYKLEPREVAVVQQSGTSGSAEPAISYKLDNIGRNRRNKMAIPLTEAREHMENLKDYALLVSRIKNDRAFARTFDPEKIKVMQGDFRSVKPYSLKTLERVVSKQEDITDEYIKAKKLLARRGVLEKLDNEDTDSTERLQIEKARDIVEAFEDLLFYAGTPSYRDTSITQAIVSRLEYSTGKRQEGKKDRFAIVSEYVANNLASITIDQIDSLVAKSARSNKASEIYEQSKIYEQVIEDTGYENAYAFLGRGFKRNITNSRYQQTGLERPRGFKRLAAVTALEFYQKKIRDPEYQEPPYRFRQQAELQQYKLAGVSGREQPSLLLEQDTGQVFLSVFVPHPKPGKKSRAMFLPVGDGQAEIPKPEDSAQVQEVIQDITNLLKGRESFSPIIDVQQDSGKSTKFNIFYKKDKSVVTLTYEDFLNSLDYGRAVMAKICADTYIKWKLQEKNIGRGEEKKEERKNAYNSLTQEDKDKIGKFTNLLSFSGWPSISQRLIAEIVRREEKAANSLALSSKGVMLTGERGVGKLNSRDLERLGQGPKVETRFTELAKKIEATPQDLEFVRSLCSDAKNLDPKVFAENLKAEANSRGVTESTLAIKLVAALGQQLQGSRGLLESSLQNLELSRGVSGKGKLDPEESLQILAKDLNRILVGLANSHRVATGEKGSEVIADLPSAEAMDLAREFEPEIPALWNIFASQYNSFIENSRPDMTINQKQKAFERLWTGFLRQDALSKLLSEQLEGTLGTKLI